LEPAEAVEVEPKVESDPAFPFCATVAQPRAGNRDSKLGGIRRAMRSPARPGREPHARSRDRATTLPGLCLDETQGQRACMANLHLDNEGRARRQMHASEGGAHTVGRFRGHIQSPPLRVSRSGAFRGSIGGGDGACQRVISSPPARHAPSSGWRLAPRRCPASPAHRRGPLTRCLLRR
jgi:hypothetical protein